MFLSRAGGVGHGLGCPATLYSYGPAAGKTAAKWWGRYRTLGLPGLRDRSSRPLHSPRRTSSELIAQVIALRRDLRPAYQIAQATCLSPATISRILQRATARQHLDGLGGVHFHAFQGSFFPRPLSRLFA